MKIISCQLLLFIRFMPVQIIIEHLGFPNAACWFRNFPHIESISIKADKIRISNGLLLILILIKTMITYKTISPELMVRTREQLELVQQSSHKRPYIILNLGKCISGHLMQVTTNKNTSVNCYITHVYHLSDFQRNTQNKRIFCTPVQSTHCITQNNDQLCTI